ncbi:MAG: DMT family transporter [Verrucomicrobia bacterium]|nr:DMT family transporter [Verrucomicrobiota bacterium]MBS0637586.1 DMT family transporter [Verrucomicrobiota bacterium]
MMYTQPTASLPKGCFFSITAFFFFALTGLFLHGASLYGASSFTATFITYLVSTAILTPYALIKGVKSTLGTERIGYHFLRAGYGIIAMLLYAYAMRRIPVMNATLLFNTAPLFIPIFGIYLLKQSVSFGDWLTILVGFIGITLVIHPDAATLENPSDIYGLLSGAFLAIAFIYIKKLNATEPPFRIVYYFITLSTLMMIPFAFSLAEMPSWHSVGMSVGAAVSLVLMQLFLTKAYSYAKPSKIGIFQYSTVIFVGLIEWQIWGIRPSLLEVAGFLLIACAGSSMIMKSNHTTPDSYR